jgi:Type I phosphodiesterase / nucleotide pyrophosphatase
MFALDGLTLVRPDFAGRGLASVASTVLRVLTGARPRLPGLDASVLPDRLSGGVRALVVVLADGLGHLQLEREIAHGNAPTLSGLLRRAADNDPCITYAPITSVFPTTTVAALGSLNSGVVPVEHGLLGYTLWLKEYGLVTEMIRWGPLDQRVSFADPPFGYSPEKFFWAPTLYQRLHAAGVEHTYAVNPTRFAGTALTRMLHQGADYRGYVATSALTVLAPRLLAERSDTPVYLYAYWPTVDTVAHVHGPESEEHSAEVFAFDAALGRLLERLPGRDDTLLLLTADHGHVQTDPEQQVLLSDHPRLLEMLLAPPAGERRVVYLHTARAADVLDYAREQLGDVAVAMTREQALAEGLFGVKQLSRRAESRIGEVLLFPRGTLQIAAGAESPATFKGLHGGLSAEEAMVPLLAMRI